MLRWKKGSFGCPFFIAALLGAANATGQIFPEAPTGRRDARSVVAKHEVVSSAHPLASAAGLAVLERGGNATDAAIATALVLNVVEPQSSGIGGGAFLLHHDARSRRLRLFDGRETAPAGVRDNLFIDAQGKPLGFFEAVAGGRSVGVPGFAAMLEQAHRAAGRLPWAGLFDEAIRLARDGFPVSPRLHALIARDRFLGNDPAARKVFFDEAGKPLAEGALLRNPDLAKTLGEIAWHGAKVLVSGPVAEGIVRAVRSHPTNPGALEVDDLARFKPTERAPLCGTYREWRVCGAPPPSSGGLVVLQILKMLEGRDLRQLRAEDTLSAHLFSEAGRLAFADRATYLADPAFERVPSRELLEPAYVSARADSIDPRRSMGTARAGQLRSVVRAQVESSELAATTHLSVVDRDGNAVALTASIENAFGARVMTGGFLLNNQLTDFSFAPTQDGAPVANRPGPGKRPLSSMAPTMVFDAAGRLLLVIGSPGGPWIPNLVAKTLVATLDWKHDLQTAIALPHFGSRNGPTELERHARADDLRRGLELLGHQVRVLDMPSGLHGIQRVAQGWLGAADPRREGVALGR